MAQIGRYQPEDQRALEALYLRVFGHGAADAGITGGRADLEHMANYLSAVLDYTRKGMAAGRSRDEIAAAEALPGFEHVTALVPSLSLAAVLGVAYDELTAM